MIATMVGVMKILLAPLTFKHYIDNSTKQASELLGIPDDSARFAICLFVSVPLAFVYGAILKPTSTASNIRQTVTLIMGVFILWFCFAWDALFVIVQPVIAYLIMLLCHPVHVHRVVFFVAMGYLSFIHIKRMLATYSYEGYVVDTSAPIMIMTIKITYASSFVSDKWYTHIKNGSSSPNKVQQFVPGALLYFSYMFHFPAVLAGPPSNFVDFEKFIHGFCGALPGESEVSMTMPSNGRRTGGRKVLASLFYLVLFLLLSPHFHEGILVESDFVDSHSVPGKILYAYIICIIVKFRYYFVFLITDAANNFCGLGFNGFDSEGNAKWDRISNVYIPGYELALNMKELLDSWNVSAALWLRKIVYERSSVAPTLVTFLASAVWHGFYPGYYLSFLTFGLITPACRMVRRKLRPFFLVSTERKLFYDIAGWFTTRVILVYGITPFVFLDLWRGLQFWSSMYYFGHILCILAIIVLRFVPQKLSKEVSLNNSNTRESSIRTGLVNGQVSDKNENLYGKKLK